jgi:TPR repeat protein
MKKITRWALALVSVLAVIVVASVLLAPKAGRLIEQVALLLQSKYPPLIGETYPEDATPTDKQKQWALATCAIRMGMNGCSHDVLGGQTEAPKEGQDLLKNWWGVDSRESLLSTLNSLECGGHRKGYDAWVQHLEQLSSEERGRAQRAAAREGGSVSNRMDTVLATRKKLAGTGLAGWDFARYVALCGWGFHAGYLNEQEAWSRIMPVARLLQKTFSSWDELAENYIEGRRFWSLKQTLKDAERLKDEVEFLRWEAHSPWARLKWDTNLLPEKQKDDGSAEFRAGRSWYYGFGNRTYDKGKSRAEAAKLFSQAAGKGNTDAMFWLGLCNMWGNGVATNMSEACAWYQKAAELGDGPSQYELGRCYYWGTGVKKDKNKVAELMAQAVTNGGGPKAEIFLGWCYEEGFGVEKSIEEAVKWYQKAAAAGEPWALENLGECYSTGSGVERSLFKAAKCFKKAAIGGRKEGMFFWAECLEKGYGTVKNEAEALEWYRKGAELGSGRAKKRLAEIEKQAAAGPR